MKASRLFLAIAFSAIIFSSFTSAKKTSDADEPMYYVSIAWEVMVSPGSTHPVITNVAYVNCEYHSTGKVAYQLVEYYNAYYRSSRNSSGINRIVSWRYDTKDKAEKKRRELIAGYNNQNWEPLLIYKFSVLCDN
ncbi:MAG TPA: hypothetical protein VIL78_09865 [Hanamia sp.]